MAKKTTRPTKKAKPAAKKPGNPPAKKPAENPAVQLGATRRMDEVVFRQLQANKNNPRKTSASLASLKASIAARGILQPLLVRETGTMTPGNLASYQVVAGARRRAAIGELIREKVLPADWIIPVLVERFSDEAAFDAATAENVVREPLHPVDEYEAFARLAGEFSMLPESIAHEYGYTVKQVKQRLALGALAPEIRDAWRDKRITAAAAQAFTLARDAKRQVEVFKQLSDNDDLADWYIRKAIVGESRREVEQAIGFVGLDAYRAAGGGVIEDLFGEHHQILDPDIAISLARERLGKRCHDLVSEGWAWAEIADDFGTQALWITPRQQRPQAFTKAEQKRLDEIAEQSEDGAVSEDLQAEADAIFLKSEERLWPKKDRSRFGCLVDLDGGGIRIHHGYTRHPSELKSGAKGAPPTAPADPGALAIKAERGLPSALSEQLSVVTTRAISETIAGDPQLAMRLLIAALLTTSNRSPLRVRTSGLGFFDGNDLPCFDKFELALDYANGLTDVSVLMQVSFLVAMSVDARISNAEVAAGDIKSLVDHLHASSIMPALVIRFDAPAFFAAAPKSAALEAIRQCAPDKMPAASASKSAFVETAIAAVKGTGWLPKEIRTVHYAGPGKHETTATEEK